MKLHIFTDTDAVTSYFTKIENSKKYSVEYYSITEAKKLVPQIEPGNFVYLDIGRIDAASIPQLIKKVTARDDLYIVVIDTKYRINDIGALFHNNVADYITKHTITEQLTFQRLQKIVNYKAIPDTTPCTDDTAEEPLNLHPSLTNFIPVSPDWSNVTPGNEYTFIFVHIFFDNYREIESNYSRDHAKKIVQRMYDFLSNAVKEYCGEVWMWMENCGLLLFPFDGKSIEPLDFAFKQMLNRKIIILENGFRTDLSYRYSLHIGNTVYQEPGNTGHIVSENVNAIFHLGNKFNTPGNIYMTEEVTSLIPERLNEYLIEVGTYEDRTISRMKLPNI